MSRHFDNILGNEEHFGIFPKAGGGKTGGTAKKLAKLLKSAYNFS